MAESYSPRIHLVRLRPQNQPSNPPELDPSDIVDEVLSTVRECRVALAECEEYQAMVIRELASRLNALEVVALRSIARKANPEGMQEKLAALKTLERKPETAK